MDTPAGQIRNSIVDLLEDIPLGHQCVQVELAPFIPPDKGGEIAVRATQAAAAGAHSTCTAIGHAPTVKMCFIFPSRYLYLRGPGGPCPMLLEMSKL